MFAFHLFHRRNGGPHYLIEGGGPKEEQLLIAVVFTQRRKQARFGQRRLSGGGRGRDKNNRRQFCFSLRVDLAEQAGQGLVAAKEQVGVFGFVGQQALVRVLIRVSGKFELPRFHVRVNEDELPFPVLRHRE